MSLSSISSLALWLDATDLSTISISPAGTDVTQWNDKSSNAYYVYQSTQASQPTWSASTPGSAWSGKSLVYFDGTDYLLRTTGTSFSDSGFTYFFVAYGTGPNNNAGLVFNMTDQAPPVNNGKYRAYLGTSSFPYSYALTMGDDNNFIQWRWSNGTTLGGKNNYYLGATSGTTGGTYSGNTNNLVYDNSGSAGSVPDTVNDISIGANNDGAAKFVGYVAEIIVYGKQLNQTEYNNVISYLQTKWNYSSW